ncbi:MAG: sugar transferase [Calditrichaeota bacterium]|nr:sugar transferase [Calditrichota bacterium]MCB9366547.1 sugar transferase [Calditrichota bacterium]MCB9391195.1 sugar transferase [Calditrichota bacterium]
MRRFWLRALQFLLDFTLLEMAFLGVYWWRFKTGQFANPVIFTFEDMIVPSLIVSAFWHLFFSVFGMYRIDPLQSRAIVLARCAQAALYGCILIFLLTFDPSNPFPTTRIVLLSYGIVVLAGSAATRLALLTILQELRYRGIGRLRTLVIGSGPQLENTLRFLEQRTDIGADLIGILSDDRAYADRREFKGGVTQIRRELTENNYELVYVALGDGKEQMLRRVVLLLGEFPVRQFLPSQQYQELLGYVRPIGQHGQLMVEIRAELLTQIERALKRVFDIVASLLLLILTSPLWLVAMILVILDTGRPVFYTQLRVGEMGRGFFILKFRTMIPNAEQQSGPVLAVRNDPRVTKVGKVLRAMRIDELPQLLNVLRGHMSLVGPRPERPEFVSEFERRTPLYARRLNVRPGMTGWAQVQLRYDATQVAPELKLQMDMYYIENMSLLLDMKILFMTMFVVLRGEG